MRALIIIGLLAVAGCDSKRSEQLVDVGYSPPSISAAPGSKPAKPTEPPGTVTPDAGTTDEEAAPPEAAAEPPAEPSSKKRHKSKRGGGVGTIGTSGSGAASGSGGSGVADGLDGLLEAKGPSWDVYLIGTDATDQTKVKQFIRRRTAVLRRCVSFYGKSAKKIRATASFDGATLKSVKTTPTNDTGAGCFLAEMSKMPFPGSPTTLTFEMRR